MAFYLEWSNSLQAESHTKFCIRCILIPRTLSVPKTNSCFCQQGQDAVKCITAFVIHLPLITTMHEIKNILYFYDLVIFLMHVVSSEKNSLDKNSKKSIIWHFFLTNTMPLDLWFCIKHVSSKNFGIHLCQDLNFFQALFFSFPNTVWKSLC